jgi:hypothetical protein
MKLTRQTNESIIYVTVAIKPRMQFMSETAKNSRKTGKTKSANIRANDDLIVCMKPENDGQLAPQRRLMNHGNSTSGARYIKFGITVEKLTTMFIDIQMSKIEH